MRKPLRIGIVGTGFAAHFHLAGYRKVYGEAFELAGIHGRDTVATQQLAERFGVARQYRSLDELLGADDIDVVDLCVPNALHEPLILQAAERGKHIICEKPLTGYFGPADGDDGWSAQGAPRQAMLDSVMESLHRIRSAVDRAGVTFCYAENWVYAPPIAKLNRLMAASDSAILRIQGEESHSGSHSRYARRWRTAGGGSLLRLGAHPIGAALFLKYEEGRRRNGRPLRPVSVLAQVARLTGIESFRHQSPHHVVADWEDVEDWGTLIVTFEDGAVAQLSATDTRLGGIHNTLTAHGSRALATANINPNTTCQAFTPDGRYFDSEYIVEKTETKAGWSFPAPDEDAVTGYPEELRDFIGAVAAGRPPKSDLLLAMDVALIVYAGYLSAEQGRSVDIRPYLAT